MEETLLQIIGRLSALEKELNKSKIIESPVPSSGSFISGSGASNQIAYFSSADVITSSAAFIVSNNNYLELLISSVSNPRGLVVTETGAAGALIMMRRNTGSAVLSGQALGNFAYDGWDGSSYALGNGGAAVIGNTTENWSGTARGALLRFLTTLTGTTSLVEVARLSDTGNFLLGTTSNGSSMVRGIGIAIGTAPTTSPANMAHIWVADANGTANRAWPYMRPEDGVNRVILGVSGDSGVSTGTGTVLMNGATNRNSVGWITTHDINGNTIFIPYWTTITG